MIPSSRMSSSILAILISVCLLAADAANNIFNDRVEGSPAVDVDVVVDTNPASLRRILITNYEVRPILLCILFHDY